MRPLAVSRGGKPELADRRRQRVTTAGPNERPVQAVPPEAVPPRTRIVGGDEQRRRETVLAHDRPRALGKVAGGGVGGHEHRPWRRRRQPRPWCQHLGGGTPGPG